MIHARFSAQKRLTGTPAVKTVGHMSIQSASTVETDEVGRFGTVVQT